VKVIAVYLLAAGALLSASMSLTTHADDFVGAEVCRTCHEKEYRLWQGSHHDWAMKPATPDYVLGDFDNVEFEHYGDQSLFFRQNGKFLVETANAEGEPETFEILYTFGVYPLQQYLVGLPGGKLQALGMAWDSRPENEGGQRWFHLYPDEKIAHDDVLHWTGPYFNWNSRCASCHSTNLEKNYDPVTQTYNTSWSEINVACEACHGPGKLHLQWAENPQSSSDSSGFNRSLGVVGRWQHQQGESTARLQVDAGVKQGEQLSTCGSCHSRRQLIDDPDKPGHYLDKYQIELLNPPLYHPDGQILDEVYVMGSFLQSKMHQQGVVCSNCHEPHSLELRAQGNAVCAQCHNPEVFDNQAHHHHPEGPGARCVNCHMPEQTYMVVDPRRDHSFRVPRPDLSIELGTPNACVQCHQDQTNEWAACAMQQWLEGSGKALSYHHGEDLARALSAAATEQQQNLAQANTLPGIVRATALAAMVNQPDPVSIEVAYNNLRDTDPLVRIGALRAFEMLPPEQRVIEVFPLLEDPVKAVRLQAASLLAAVPGQALNSYQRTTLATALEEYQDVLEMHADTSEGQFNLGVFYTDRGNYPKAVQAYQRSLEQNSRNLAASINLADVYRVINQDHKGEPVLRAAINASPQQAGPYHSLGLLLIRQRNYDEAEEYLARAAELAPENIRYGYVYAISLTSQGKVGQGLEVLETLHQRQPDDVQVLYALVETYMQQGQTEDALMYAQKLQALMPNSPDVEHLVRYLSQ
jgi:predicted CXXCH cytochrome family protein